MDITPLIRSGQKIIQSYASGRFKISGEMFETALIVTPDEIFEWNVSVAKAEDLSFADFKPLMDIAADLDVVLLGGGQSMPFIKPILKQQLKDNGIYIDAMDTGAACRTYNVLMAEGRRVAAALLPV